MDNRKKPQAAVTRSLIFRAITVCVVSIIAFGAIIYRLYMLQIKDEENYSAQAAQQQLRDEIITPARGTIYDSDMKILAESSLVWTVEASPLDMKKNETDISALSAKLAEILEIKYEDVLAKLQKSSTTYQLIKRQIEKPKADAIREHIKTYNADEANEKRLIGGLTLRQDSKRYYPYSNFASTVLGFTNVDGDGVTGLELVYNDILKGTPGRVLAPKNAKGYDMEGVDYETKFDAEDGNALVVTINENIQHSLEKHLLAAVKEHNVTQRGVGIAMNPKTGAILAMASMQDYDLNKPFEIQDTVIADQIAAIENEEERTKAKGTALWAQRRNKAVQDIYEPGSVFKIITAAAALDSGTATLETSFSCAGYFDVIAGTRMKCAENRGHGVLNFSQGLDVSCNPYFIQIGQRMGKDIFCDYLQSFGFMEKTGIDMEDEGKNIVYNHETMQIVQLASSSFGQSSAVTPISMITAISAAVNGGKLMQPHVVSKVLDANGNVVKSVEPVVKRQVISEQTSKTICKLLEDSVNLEGGHGTNAQVMGYRVGGKSGTSQKLNNLLDPEARIASFVGFAPANDPEIVVLVFLDEPHSPTNSSYGGRLSAPVVANVIREAMPYLGVEPQYSEEELKKIDVSSPNTVGTAVETAKTQLAEIGLNVKVMGNGGTVTYQYPAANALLPRTSTVILYTDENAEGTKVLVPDTFGKTMAQTKEAITAAGLNVKTTGPSGKSIKIVAADQNIPANTEVEMGTIITVNFHDTTVVPED